MAPLDPTPGIASNLFNTGAERLALLGKYHKQLMQGYLDGYVDETAFSEGALKKLIAARILWRPDEQQPLALRPLVSELIASMVADENRRQINADVAEKLEQLRALFNDFEIRVGEAVTRPGPDVNTAEDLARVSARLLSERADRCD